MYLDVNQQKGGNKIMSIKIRSRIHEFFSRSLLEELHKICRNSTISDNNMKVSIILDTLTYHGVDFVELGPGTNRLAILIDNYVFKIALDKAGLQDNLNEFTVSQELQPYVVKTYETNSLLSVCEYVTVISKEEFANNKEEIRSVLAILADSYLLGDVGSVNKNFANWGYRDNGELVVLDFAYIHRVQGDELLCSKDQSILEYDENFYNLICPTCRSKYSFMDVRRKITVAQEKQENEIAKQLAYKLTEPIQEFESKPGYNDEEDDETSSDSLYINNNTNNPKEDNTMLRDERDFDEVSEEETEDSYLALLESMQQNKNMVPVETDEEDEKPKKEEGSVSVIQIESETATEKSQIRVYAQTTPKAEAEVIEEAAEVLEEVSEALKLVPEFEEPTAPEQEDIEAGDAKLVVEDGHFVGPVNDEVVEGVFQEIKEEVMPSEESQEGGDGLDDEDGDDAFDAIIKGIESTGAQIRMEDVDGDGHKELVIDTSVEPQTHHDGDDEDEELSEEEQKYADIMDNHEDSLRAELQGDVHPREDEGEVVFNNTVKVNDEISVENTVTVHVNNNNADALRKELALDVEGSEEPLVIQEDRIEKLAEDYSHLDDEPTDYNISRNKSNRDWK